MAKLVKNITAEVNSGYESNVTVFNTTGEFGEGDYINITNHLGFYQDLEYATEIIELQKPATYGLTVEGRIETVIEISY